MGTSIGTKQYLLQENALLRQENEKLKKSEEKHWKDGKSLRETERLLRMAVENSNDGFAIIQDGIYVYANQYLLKKMGIRRKEIIGRKFGSFIHPDDHDSFLEYYRKVQQKLSAADSIETRVVLPNGTVLYAEYSLVRAKYKGKPALLATAHDVTTRKKMETALKESDERFRALFDGSLDGIYIHDLKGNYLEMNQSSLETTGYNIDEITNLNVRSLLDDEQLSKVMQVAKELKGNGLQKELVEFKVKCKDESYIHTENRSAMIYRNGKPYAVVGIARNITERKKIEAEREKLIQELREALSHVKTLSGLLPICASCKKIRDDKGYWNQLESYIASHSQAEFSHGICPECAKKLYPKFYQNK